MMKNFDDLLLQTFEDQHLSRKEKQLIKEILEDTHADEQKLALYRHQAFETAREALTSSEAKKVLNWLEDVVKALQNNPRNQGNQQTIAEAYFSPGDACPEKIAQLFSRAQRKVDVCVFTITDNRISRAILDAHKRGVALRIITDDEKRHDPGSDIFQLHQVGIPVRIDATEYHMHHKFALFDNVQLLTGSYNWTRGAAEHNEENFIISSDPHLLREFS